MSNYKIYYNLPAKNLPLKVNELYFRDSKASRALTLEEFKDCMKRLRCFARVSSGSIYTNLDEAIIASYEVVEEEAIPFVGHFTTRWKKKDNFVNKLRRKEVNSKTKVKYNELPLMSLKDAELLLIKRALLETCGSIKQAAAILNIRPLLLQDKIRRYKL